jgi:acetyl esterase/lipase
MTLRFGAVRVPTSVHWPQTATMSVALVLTAELSATNPLVANFTVITLAGSQPAEIEFAALQWLGDHAGQLGASPEHVLVAGGARTTMLAVAARDSGWPALERQLIVHPSFCAEHPMPTDVSGVAPATVVCGGDDADDGARYAGRLRHAGVPVEEVHDGNRFLGRG